RSHDGLARKEFLGGDLPSRPFGPKSEPQGRPALARSPIKSPTAQPEDAPDHDRSVVVERLDGGNANLARLKGPKSLQVALGLLVQAVAAEPAGDVRAPRVDPDAVAVRLKVLSPDAVAVGGEARVIEIE